MRIFIRFDDACGSKRTIKISISHCTTTTHITKAICKEIGTKKIITVIKLKYQPFDLRIVQGWPLTHYPIKNGSIFLVEFIQYLPGDKISLIQEDSDQYLTERDSISNTSFISDLNHREDLYLQQCLSKVIQAVKLGDLAKIAAILKEEPNSEREENLIELLNNKNTFLINQIGDQGKNALHWAIQTNNIDILSFLLIKGSNPSIQTHRQYTPLHLAVQNNNCQIVKVLLQQKLTDINSLSQQGTALHIAIRQNNFDIVKLLLQHGANIQILDSNGLQPVMLCRNKKLKQLLLKKKKMSTLQNKQVLSISKGTVYKVSNYMYRHKLNIMVVNPYKKMIHFENQDTCITSRYPLENLKKVERVSEISWLMNQSYFYLKLYFYNPDKTQILLALRNEKTYERWLSKFNTAIEAIDMSQLSQPIVSSDQIIQIINDETNQIIFHKRKVQKQPVSRMFKNQSILNLPLQPQEPQFHDKVRLNLTPQRLTVPANLESYSNEHLKYKDSEIVVGSIINECSTNKSPGSEYSFPDIIQESTEEIFAKSLIKIEGSSQPGSKFRKQSEKIDIVSDFRLEDKVNIVYQDFEVIKRIGTGSFGQVYLARYIRTNNLYALKVLNKRKLIAKKQLKYAVSQANIMKKLDSSFVITLHYAFETPLHLYMAIDHCPNGDLSQVIAVRDRLKQSTACFIIAQIILAIQYLHSKNILYRDLKPQNILVASDGYIKLTDFGLSKQNCFAMSFCGSPAYLSPEMLEKKGVGFQSDLYGIGAVLFEMVVGQPPYFDQNMDIMFENIKAGKLRYPSHMSIEVKSLIGKLIQKEPSKRLGKGDINQIKKHDFFKKLNWKHLAMKRIHVPRQIFINEQDSHLFEPVNLQTKKVINLEEDDYGDSSSNIMNRISNFTFARDPNTTRLPKISNPIISKQIF